MNISQSAFRNLQRFIRFQLEREIALQAWGDAGEFLRMMDTDRVLQRALALLEDSRSSEELLSLATDPARSDWRPVLIPADAPDGDGTTMDEEGDPSS